MFNCNTTVSPWDRKGEHLPADPAIRDVADNLYDLELSIGLEEDYDPVVGIVRHWRPLSYREIRGFAESNGHSSKDLTRHMRRIKVAEASKAKPEVVPADLGFMKNPAAIAALRESHLLMRCPAPKTFFHKTTLRHYTGHWPCLSPWCPICAPMLYDARCQALEARLQRCGFVFVASGPSTKTMKDRVKRRACDHGVNWFWVELCDGTVIYVADKALPGKGDPEQWAKMHWREASEHVRAHLWVPNYWDSQYSQKWQSHPDERRRKPSEYFPDYDLDEVEATTVGDLAIVRVKNQLGVDLRQRGRIPDDLVPGVHAILDQLVAQVRSKCSR
jgi:hypothetical protein